MKEILLYTSIYSFTAADFIRQLAEAGDSDVVVRINTGGGSPEDAYGMIAKLKELKGNVTVKVDGRAYSMGAFILCYADDVEALEVSQFLFHRAAYPSWIESDPQLMTEERKAGLKLVNDQLRKAMEAKIDVAKFEAMKGVKIDQIFSLDSRIDVVLTAKEAKKVGLINRIVTITPQKKAEIESAVRLAAEANPEVRMPELTITAAPVEEPKKPSLKTSNKMTLSELRAQHPELVNQIEAAAVTAERNRVNAWMAWSKTDPERVAKAIKEGEEFTPVAMSELVAKATANQGLKNLKDDSQGATETGQEQNPEEGNTAETAAFLKEFKGMAGLKV